MKLVYQKACPPPHTHTKSKITYKSLCQIPLQESSLIRSVQKESISHSSANARHYSFVLSLFLNFLCLWTLRRKITSSPFDIILYSLNTQDKHFLHLLPIYISSLINFLSICSTQFFFWSTNLHLAYWLSSLYPGSLWLKYAAKIIF